MKQFHTLKEANLRKANTRPAAVKKVLSGNFFELHQQINRSAPYIKGITRFWENV